MSKHLPCPLHERPLAANGLQSYRYAGRLGFVMIGARNHDEALQEAQRSLTSEVAVLSQLQVWDGEQYAGIADEEASPDCERPRNF